MKIWIWICKNLFCLVWQSTFLPCRYMAVLQSHQNKLKKQNKTGDQYLLLLGFNFLKYQGNKVYYTKYLYTFFKKIIYLAQLKNKRFFIILLKQMESLSVAACKIFSCGMWDLVPWPWVKHQAPYFENMGAPAIGPPGKSCIISMWKKNYICYNQWDKS